MCFKKLSWENDFLIRAGRHGIKQPGDTEYLFQKRGAEGRISGASPTGFFAKKSPVRQKSVQFLLIDAETFPGFDINGFPLVIPGVDQNLS